MSGAAGEGMSFHTWANNLRAGGLHRNGTEGTSGRRCAALTGTPFPCGICHQQAPGHDEAQADRLNQGHPYWYTHRRVKTGDLVCPQPDKVRAMNYGSATFFALVLVSAPVALTTIVYLSR